MIVPHVPTLGVRLFLVASALSSSALAQSNPLIAAREALLQSSMGAPLDSFGVSLDLDGDWAVVGAPRVAFTPATPVGAAYVFERTPQGWIQRAELRASDGASGDQFGDAVAIDGDRIAIGAYTASSSAFQSGAIYVFERAGSTWNETAKLSGVGADIGEGLGWSLALEGDTLIAGAVDDHHLGGQFDGGAAYHFEHTAAGWVQQARLIAGDGEAFDYFGRAVALDGDWLAVGAYSDNHASAPNGGSVYVYYRSGPSFTLTQKLVPADNAANDQFGWSLDLHAGELVVGAPGDSAGAVSGAGSTYVFAQGAVAFFETQKLFAPSPTAGAMFGSAVAWNGDALLVGAQSADSPVGPLTGDAFLFQRNGSDFAFNVPLRSTAVEQTALFGASVAFDGRLALIGAPSDDTSLGGPNVGTAYAYRVEPQVQTYCTAKVNGLGCTPVIGWSGSPNLTASSPFVVTASNVLSQKVGLLLYGYAPNAAPFQGGTLCVAPPLVRTGVQDSGGAATLDCSGAYSFDFGARLASGVDPALIAGAEAFAQYWSRDPLSSPAVGLTDALHLHVRP